MKFKKGDQVIVTTGKDKGRKGKIEKIFPRKNLVLIPGLNLVKKHLRKQGEGKPGGIVDLVKPIIASKLALLCPKCNQPTRIGWRSKERICKKCQAAI